MCDQNFDILWCINKNKPRNNRVSDVLWCVIMVISTGGRGRTDTSVKTRDFESRASANSATPAHYY